VRATTRRGHTEARVEKVDMPIRLDFGVIFEHVGQVIHDLSHHEMLVDAGRLLGHKELQSAIYDTYGDVVFKEFKKALVDIAVGDQPAGNAPGRSRCPTCARARPSPTWVERDDLAAAAAGPVQLHRAGRADVGRQGPEPLVARRGQHGEHGAWIHDRSEFMRVRHKTQQREINEIRNSLGVQRPASPAGWTRRCAPSRSTRHEAGHRGLLLLADRQGADDRRHPDLAGRLREGRGTGNLKATARSTRSARSRWPIRP
jgi:hypothetical protein